MDCIEQLRVLLPDKSSASFFVWASFELRIPMLAASSPVQVSVFDERNKRLSVGDPAQDNAIDQIGVRIVNAISGFLTTNAVADSVIQGLSVDQVTNTYIAALTRLSAVLSPLEKVALVSATPLFLAFEALL